MVAGGFANSFQVGKEQNTCYYLTRIGRGIVICGELAGNAVRLLELWALPNWPAQADTSLQE